MRLLVVEPIPEGQAVLARSLRLAIPRIQLETCGKTSTALAKLRLRPFDAVLANVLQMDLSGMALVREVTRLAWGVPVVLFSSKRCFEQDALIAGAAAFVRMPCCRTVLAQAVKRAVTQLDMFEALEQPLSLGLSFKTELVAVDHGGTIC